MPLTTRRQFVTTLAITMAATANLTALSACQGIQPRPFTTGRTITPPQGCTELLKRDQQGDC